MVAMAFTSAFALVLAVAGCGSNEGGAASSAQAEQELQQLREANQELQKLRAENQELPRLRRDGEERQRLLAETEGLAKLRAENDQLRAQLLALKQPKRP